MLFRGCEPAVAAGVDGRILAVGDAATNLARDADVADLHGRAHPGFADSHVHLGWTARQRMTLDLTGAVDAADAVQRVRRHASSLPPDAWVVGHHLDDSTWRDDDRLHAAMLDGASGGRPVFIHRRDTHLAWVSTAAFAIAGIDRDTPDPAGGVIDRDDDGKPSGIVRENAAEVVRVLIPEVSADRLRAALGDVVRDLVAAGTTSVHAIESADDYAILRAMRETGELPLRVSAFLRLASLDDLVSGGVRSGHGDDVLRIQGVKVFLDGSLGSDTAEMLDGRGVVVVPQGELTRVIARVAGAGLNVAVHAIGDAAVRRCLDAFEAQESPGPHWRPRIEHAQCVDPADVRRFVRLGVIASMQPLHAVSDREIADRRWRDRCAFAFAWRPLHDTGTRIAFGSDAPVDDPSPLRGIDAATRWRHRTGWYPELAIDERAAITAYTRDAAYAVGMEDRLGVLAPGAWCDMSVVDTEGVVATIVAGEVVWRR